MVDYAVEKGLLVDAEWLWNYYEAGEWHDKFGEPVRSWKQKMWTSHRKTLEHGGCHKCQKCDKPGVYIEGKDRDGHPYYYCHDHKPKPKPMPKEVAKMAVRALKRPNYNVVNFHNERNKQRKGLGL